MAEPQWAAAPASARACRRDRWAAAAVGLCLVLAVAFVYAPVAQHEFVYCDDDRYVFENPVVRAGLT
ncbi:MAG: hypothetical protein OER90_14455 [Gemmatimonadota bacterium]|nr:hypothetical protein [Gemmatimonadota bacterium]